MTRILRMFPLSTVLFPHAGLPLHVFEERYRRMMADCLAGDREFGVVLIARGSEVGGGDQRVDIGTVAPITDLTELDDGRMLVMARGGERVVSTGGSTIPYPSAEVDGLPLRSRGPTRLRGRRRASRAQAAVAPLGVRAGPRSPTISIPGSDEDAVAALRLAPLNLLDRQQLLDSAGLETRMGLLAGLSTAMAGDVLALLAGGLVGSRAAG